MRYGLGILGIVVVALIAIVLIVSRPANTTSTSKPVAKAPAVVNLLDHDKSDSAVKLTIQGRLVGEEQRRSIRLTVSQSQRTVDVIQGYEGNVIKSETLPNTPAAYSTFLRALNNSGFTRYRKGANSDERGSCPQEYRFIYELNKGSQQIQRLWSSSCGSAEGSYAGSGPRVRDLFERQIPEYDKFITGVRLY